MATTPNMGLITWPNLNDVFNHTQLATNFTALDQHDHTSGKGVPVGAGGIGALAVGTTQLQDTAVTTSKLTDLSVTTPKLADNNVTLGKLDGTSVGVPLGLNLGGVTRRGKSIIATTGTRTNAAYGALSDGPDSVSVTLPTDGLIFILYQALWQESVQGVARAAIFIGGTQLKVQAVTGVTRAPVTSATLIGDGTARDKPLVTSPYGLTTLTGFGSGATFSGDVTTGQTVGVFSAQIPPPAPSSPGNESNAIELNGSPGSGYNIPTGICSVFAAAGTYAVSVQFLASSGTVTVKNRRLWVWTQGF
jgi:hypothetical protein